MIQFNKMTILIRSAVILLLVTFHSISFAQSKKDTVVGVWRTCGLENMDEEADTLIFQKPSPECRYLDCSEHQWIFKESGSVEFIFTTGCNSGFNSKTKYPKRWMYSEKTGMIKFVTMDGFKEFYELKKVNQDELILIRRKDLD